MPRELSERDCTILSVMAEEYAGESCKGSGTRYKSILPPVANHYAKGADDFKERLYRLSLDDFRYLIDLMLSGEESLHCLNPEYFAILEERVRTVAGDETARQIGAQYAFGCF